MDRGGKNVYTILQQSDVSYPSRVTSVRDSVVPTFIERAYRWFSMTWLGSGSKAGSHCQERERGTITITEQIIQPEKRNEKKRRQQKKNFRGPN